MFLTRDQLIELTGKQRRDAQRRELNSMGIIHEERSDGSLVVLQAHIIKRFDGAQESIQKREEPNWDAL